MTIHHDLANDLLDHVLGGGDYARLATVYIGLSSTIPVQAGTGFTEPSGGSYARIAITNNVTNFPAAASGAKQNGVGLNFLTASADWLAGALLIYCGVFAAASGGNPIMGGAITPTRSVLNGQSARFLANSITFQMK